MSVYRVSATTDMQILTKIYRSPTPPRIFRNTASSLQKLNKVSVEEGRTTGSLLYGKHQQQHHPEVPLTQRFWKNKQP